MTEQDTRAFLRQHSRQPSALQICRNKQVRIGHIVAGRAEPIACTTDNTNDGNALGFVDVPDRYIGQLVILEPQEIKRARVIVYPQSRVEHCLRVGRLFTLAERPRAGHAFARNTHILE